MGFLSAKIWAGIIGLGALAAAGWFVVHTIERAALAEAEVEGYEQVLKHQNKTIVDFEKRLKEHQKKARANANELSLWKQKWKSIQSDESVADWVHTPYPDPVRERVRELITPPGGEVPDRGAFVESNSLAYLFQSNQW